MTDTKQQISRDTIRKFVLKLGLSPALKGFNYVISGIEILMNDRNASITKVLYPTIAKEYNTTVSGVDRAIRHASENLTGEYGAIEHLENMFGCKLYKEKLCNSTLLYYCVTALETN